MTVSSRWRLHGHTHTHTHIQTWAPPTVRCTSSELFVRLANRSKPSCWYHVSPRFERTTWNGVLMVVNTSTSSWSGALSCGSNLVRVEKMNARQKKKGKRNSTSTVHCTAEKQR